MKGSIIIILSVVLLISSPSYAAKKDKVMAEQLQRLEDMVKILDEKVTAIATDTASMSGSIKNMEEKLKGIAISLADSSQNKENLMLSLQFLKEELNELKNNINRINDRLVSMPVVSPQTPTDNNMQSEPENASPAPAAETSYYAAYSDYIKKNYPLAIEGFKQFLKIYSKHDLADNALYWIGECYYSQKMFKEAVSTFTELISGYPQGDKIPDAILKKGYSLIEMGKQADGIATLKELISRFPLSEEASLAQQKIKEVNE